MNFDTAFALLLGHEGAFQADPKDRGNWTTGVVGQGTLKGTKYGISAMTYPGEDIANLTVERAKALYFRDVWGPAGCDAIPPSVRFDVFDTAVHSGVQLAVKLLQRAAGAVDDGKLGARTILQVQTVDPTRLVARFNGWRLDYMNGLKAWEHYHEGWSQRIAENLKRI